LEKLFVVLPQKQVNIKAKVAALTVEPLDSAHIAGDALQCVGSVQMNVVFYWDQLGPRHLRIASFVSEEFVVQEAQAGQRDEKRKRTEMLKRGDSPVEVDMASYREAFGEDWTPSESLKKPHRLPQVSAAPSASASSTHVTVSISAPRG
jgi:hypothetical protein